MDLLLQWMERRVAEFQFKSVSRIQREECLENSSIQLVRMGRGVAGNQFISIGREWKEGGIQVHESYRG